MGCLGGTSMSKAHHISEYKLLGGTGAAEGCCLCTLLVRLPGCMFAPV